MGIQYNYIDGKKRWNDICNSKDYYIPIYHKDWYWDAVCDSTVEWKVIIFEDDNILAAFPFLYHKVHGMWRIENPWQVSRGGIWIHTKKELSIEKQRKINDEIVEYILERLPQYDYFNINFLPEYFDWAPFYWRGFNVNVNYNYYIENRAVEKLKSECSKKRRQRINTSERKYDVKLNKISLEEYWEFFRSTFEQRGRELSFPKEKFNALLTELKRRDAVQIRSAYFNEELVAVAIYMEDNKCLYHQFCAMTPGNNDAQTALTYSALVYAMNCGKKFDFEGSMIKGVAEYNLSYSPEREICYAIHNESGKYKKMNALRTLLKRG